MAEPVAAQIRPPQGMSLGEMVNMANAVQQYQQRAATNPLELEKQKYLTQTAGQEARSGEIGLGKTEQENQERLALQEFNSNPDNYMSNGRIDLKKAYNAIPRIAPLTGGAVLDKLTSLANAQTGVQESKQKLTQKQREIISDRMAVLGRLGIQDPESYKRELQILQKVNPDNPELHELISHYTSLFDNIPAGDYVAQGAIREAQSLLSPEQQEAAFGTKVANVDTGPEIVQQAITPSIGGEAPKIQPLGTIRKAPAPMVTTAPTETGATKFMVYPGAPAAGGQTAPAQPPAQPATQPAAKPVVKPAPTDVVKQFEKQGGIQRAPDETFDAYKERVGRLSKLPTFASNAMSLGNPESVPNVLSTNDKILKLLDDKDVNVGKVSNFIAGKTAGITLNPKEQTIQKYLEQRARQVSTRSNQDQESVRAAYGNFGNDKDTLRNIIYNDKGILSAESLYNQGVLNARGNPSKPNLAAIADFEAKFSNLTKDPDVMHLIGLFGNKSMSQLSESDKKQFKRYFKGKDLENLFKQKEAVEKLSKGEQ